MARKRGLDDLLPAVHHLARAYLHRLRGATSQVLLDCLIHRLVVGLALFSGVGALGDLAHVVDVLRRVVNAVEQLLLARLGVDGERQLTRLDLRVDVRACLVKGAPSAFAVGSPDGQSDCRNRPWFSCLLRSLDFLFRGFFDVDVDAERLQLHGLGETLDTVRLGVVPSKRGREFTHLGPFACSVFLDVDGLESSPEVLVGKRFVWEPHSFLVLDVVEPWGA